MRRLAISLAAIMATGFAAQGSGIRLNASPSMPLGVWIGHKATAHDYTVGDTVLVCPVLTEAQRVYLKPGSCANGLEPMLKPIAAIAGDRVETEPTGVTINGHSLPNTAPLTRNGRGDPIQAYPFGTRVVRPGEVWLIVPRRDSFDSRYLGPVPVLDIVSLAAPLVVWR